MHFLLDPQPLRFSPLMILVLPFLSLISKARINRPMAVRIVEEEESGQQSGWLAWDGGPTSSLGRAASRFFWSQSSSKRGTGMARGVDSVVGTKLIGEQLVVGTPSLCR